MVTALNFFHREIISTTVPDLSDLPFLGYRGIYGKNVEKNVKVWSLWGSKAILISI